MIICMWCFILAPVLSFGIWGVRWVSPDFSWYWVVAYLILGWIVIMYFGASVRIPLGLQLDALTA